MPQAIQIDRTGETLLLSSSIWSRSEDPLSTESNLCPIEATRARSLVSHARVGGRAGTAAPQGVVCVSQPAKGLQIIRTVV